MHKGTISVGTSDFMELVDITPGIAKALALGVERAPYRR